MVKYSCERCGKGFSQKSHYDSHNRRKTPCENNADKRIVTMHDGISQEEAGFDIGPETTLQFKSMLNNAETIIWNGTLGVCEVPSFAIGTQSIATIVGEKTKSGAKSIIGGGDTAASLLKNTLYSEYTHVSTGGGALLKNIDKLISKETGLPVQIAEDPLSCVAIGTGKALDEEQTFAGLLVGQ